MHEIIDTHQHLWDLSRHGHSWCAGIPLLNRSFLPSDYASAAAGRVSRAVFVECDADGPDIEREAKWAAGLTLAPGATTVAVVAGCRPEHDGFEAYLDRIAHPSIKGVRRVLHTQPDDLCTGSTFTRSVQALATRGLAFDLCSLPKQLKNVLQLVRACPKVNFILDHCGIPDVKGMTLDPWRADITALAREHNVVACKVSGLVAYADQSKDLLTQITPFLDHAAESFGKGRLIFGGDWPVCLLSGPLVNWIEILERATASWSHDDRAALFAGNAKRVYRLD